MTIKNNQVTSSPEKNAEGTRPEAGWQYLSEKPRIARAGEETDGRYLITKRLAALDKEGQPADTEVKDSDTKVKESKKAKSKKKVKGSDTKVKVSDTEVKANDTEVKAELTAAVTESLPEESGPILSVEHLSKYFPIKKNFFGKPTEFLRAVDDVSFEVERGTAIGIVGESGCGKTTLGRTILRLYPVDAGKVTYNGTAISELKPKQMRKFRTDMQLIFQDPYSSLPPRMTVGSIIAEGVRAHNIVPKKEVYDYVIDIMKKCGLQPQYYYRYPHEFSGGQRQRICIARALAVKPKIVVCDEPVSALDVSIQAQIINLLKELQEKMGLTYLFISHDLSVVKYITDQIMVMYLGTVMELGKTERIFANPLHPYTKALFSAVPVPDPSVKMNRIILEGDIPSPANPPKGCKFHTRCSECMSVCRMLKPEYLEAEEGHFVACHLYNKEVMADFERYDREYEAEQARIKEEEAKKSKHNGKESKKAQDKVR